MKITKRQLRRIIRESVTTPGDEPRFQNAGEQYLDDMAMQGGEFQGSLMDLEDYQRLENLLQRDLKVFLRGGYTKEDIIEALKSIIEEM